MVVHRLILGVVVALMAFGPRMNDARAQQKPVYTAVFSSDSLDLQSPTLSPNGKWVVFVARWLDKETRWLMIIPTAGGTPQALTTGDFNDTHPVWFPTGDRIVFRSSRVKDALMTLRIDTAPGRAIGNPQRLTLEPVQRWGFAVSPDGKQVAFVSMPAKGVSQLKLVPAGGGNARVVANVSDLVAQMYWPAPDTLLYGTMAVSPNLAPFNVMRLSPRGGSPVLVQTYDQNHGFAYLGPGYTLRGARVRIAGDTIGTLSVVHGRADTVVRFDTRGGIAYGGLNQRIRTGPGAQTVMVATHVRRAATRMLSIDGGAPKNLTPERDGSWFEYPYGFTADGRNAWIHAENGRRMLLAPLDGGAPRSIPLPGEALWPDPVPSGRYIYSREGHSRDTTHALHIVDTGSGRAELISRAAIRVASAEETGDDSYYGEYRNGVLEIRRWSPGKGSTLLHTVPPGRHNGEPFYNSLALSPDARAYAFARVDGDSTRIFIGDAAGTRQVLAARGLPRSFHWGRAGQVLAARVREPAAGNDSMHVMYVATFDAQMRQSGPARAVARTAARGSFSAPTWSPDGSTLAVGVEQGTPDPYVGVLFFPFDAKMGEIGAPKRADIPPPATEWDDLAWTKDTQTLLVLTYSESTNRSLLWRIPRVGNSAPVNIAAQETDLFWEFVVAPDGKKVAYLADMAPRTTIWRIDLPR